MELSDVANLLAYIGAKLTYRAGMSRVAVDDMTVRAWKSDLDHGNCNHVHIAVKAVDDHFRSPAGQYGITPGELVNAYNRIAVRIVSAVEDRVPVAAPDDVTAYLDEQRRRRQSILADPVKLAAIEAQPKPQPALDAVPTDPKVLAAIRASMPEPSRRLQKLDKARMAEAKAELDALRVKLESIEGEPA